MLDGDHRALVEAVLPVCSRYGLGIAGGYAVKAHGLVERPSEDIDFATMTAAPIMEVVDALAAAYLAAGFTVRILDADLRKGHAEPASAATPNAPPTSSTRTAATTKAVNADGCGPWPAARMRIIAPDSIRSRSPVKAVSPSHIRLLESRASWKCECFWPSRPPGGTP